MCTLCDDCSRGCCSHGNQLLDQTRGKTSLPFPCLRFHFHINLSAKSNLFSSHDPIIRNQFHHGCEDKHLHSITDKKVFYIKLLILYNIHELYQFKFMKLNLHRMQLQSQK